MRVYLSLTLSGALWAWSAGAEELPLHTLGTHPLCEASAATVVDCGRSGAACLLVGDNEVRDRLFRFALDGTDVKDGSQREISLASQLDHFDEDRGELSDIEGLARLTGGAVLVMGSHSRNTRCELKPERRRLLLAGISPGGAASGEAASQSAEHDCASLFTPAARRSGLVARVCNRIESAERAADAAASKEKKKQRRQACDRALPLNAEGVVAILGPQGTDEVWVGLRAPLLDGKAILLRQSRAGGAFRFNAVALVDLGGRGIRELAHARGRLLGIAGPDHDGDGEFSLWHAPAGVLSPDVTLVGEVLTELPPRSEGLAVLDREALVLIDGDNGSKRATACKVPARYTVVPLPF